MAFERRYVSLSVYLLHKCRHLRLLQTNKLNVRYSIRMLILFSFDSPSYIYLDPVLALERHDMLIFPRENFLNMTLCGLIGN